MSRVWKFAACLVPLLTAAVWAQTAAPAAQNSPKVVTVTEKPTDWAQLTRYRGENVNLPAPAAGVQRVVFFGDSITDNWGRHAGVFFPGKPYVNRGISGQTTPQMLVRFEQDVIHLHPAAVVILAGTNDIAGNTGPSTPQMTEDNLSAMAAVAKQNGIRVIVASITPADRYPWKPGIDPVPPIREINQWIQGYCEREGLVYLDYFSAMTDGRNAMRPGLSSDGVHPTTQGYEVMGPLAEAAIAKALQP